MGKIIGEEIYKYSKYQLINKVKEVKDFKLDPDEQLLYEQILAGVVLKPKHYQLICKLLNMPIEEITQTETETGFEKIYYSTANEVSKEEIEPIIDLFRVFSEQAKIKGDINC
ncbi:hypothetical protein [Staphylococcus auricularis]|uniref:Uncharacterized protein n=1 Tax=Staphylococcus auricularis TaxID=29379 RepID=A0ABX5IDR1_9STAP|nr:hypothetical protein [Staphylococcus auricularis]MCE5037584.1 hypothetical protein [Staphylococcus auricularis]MEB6569893.1 hypothetical protein [Staphylococcus auricularis]PTH13842.1 hypothetical protein BU607_09470 [Staphylococcus auricularis]PTH24664.1 hypothetical protein BU608_09875 [Staphylococcus auricularis]